MKHFFNLMANVYKYHLGALLGTLFIVNGLLYAFVEATQHPLKSMILIGGFVGGFITAHLQLFYYEFKRFKKKGHY